MKSARYVLLSLLVLVFAGGVVTWLNRDLMYVGAASVSQSLCAAAFVSHVDPDRVYTEEQRPLLDGINWAVRYTVDRSQHEVRSSLLAVFRARSVYRDGLGCTLVLGDDPLRAAGFSEQAEPDGFGGRIVTPTDPALRAALDQAFAEPDPSHLRQTKAVVVLHDGQLIAERYAKGYGPETPIWVHSVTKSVTQALIGVLVRQGRLRLDQPAPIAAWASAADPHHAITVDQLLRMDSGLPFDETNGAVDSSKTAR